MARRERRERMEAVLADLSPRRRQVGRLLLDGWSVPDIARELGSRPAPYVTIGARCSRHGKGAGELKSYLEGS